MAEIEAEARSKKQEARSKTQDARRKTQDARRRLGPTLPHKPNTKRSQNPLNHTNKHFLLEPIQTL
jgi:hypothetical protein